MLGDPPERRSMAPPGHGAWVPGRPTRASGGGYGCGGENTLTLASRTFHLGGLRSAGSISGRRPWVAFCLHREVAGLCPRLWPAPRWLLGQDPPMGVLGAVAAPRLAEEWGLPSASRQAAGDHRAIGRDEDLLVPSPRPAEPQRENTMGACVSAGCCRGRLWA